MIRGYETETTKLNESDLKIARILAKAFNTMLKGKDYQITNYKIVERLQTIDVKTSEIKIRKLIQYIRINNMAINLCSDNGGYWIAETPEELKFTIDSLKDRVKNQLATIEALEKQYSTMRYETNNSGNELETIKELF